MDQVSADSSRYLITGLGLCSWGVLFIWSEIFYECTLNLWKNTCISESKIAVLLLRLVGISLDEKQPHTALLLCHNLDVTPPNYFLFIFVDVSLFWEKFTWISIVLVREIENIQLFYLSRHSNCRAASFYRNHPKTNVGSPL